MIELALWIIVLLIVLALVAVAQYSDRRRGLEIQVGPNPYFFVSQGEVKQAKPSELPRCQLEELVEYAASNWLPPHECPNCGWEFWILGESSCMMYDMKCENCGEPITVDTANERQEACGSEIPPHSVLR